MWKYCSILGGNTTTRCWLQADWGVTNTLRLLCSYLNRCFNPIYRCLKRCSVNRGVDGKKLFVDVLTKAAKVEIHWRIGKVVFFLLYTCALNQNNSKKTLQSNCAGVLSYVTPKGLHEQRIPVQSVLEDETVSKMSMWRRQETTHRLDFISQISWR